MKIKNIFASVVAAILMGLGTSSCDYLDVVPVEQPSVDNTMDNYTQALGYLYQCYRGVTQPIASDWGQGFSYYWGQPLPGNILSDITCTTDEWMMDDVLYSQAPLVRTLYSNSVSSANNYNDYYCYSIWLSSTFVFLDKLETIGIPKGIVTPEEATEWKAEAKFLLAYYHFMLLRRYGPIAIVEKRLPMDAPISAFPGRMHYDYCVKWICDKLDEAAEDLPVRRQSAETGRATSLICKALKARILLYAASPLFNGQFPYPDWTNKVETPGYGTELISRTYDRNKWEVAKKASEEALALALGEGQRSLYQGGGAESAAMVDVSYFPVDNLDENFIRKVLTMRNVVCAKESEGNHEHIWASPDLTNVLVSIYRFRIPHNVVPKSASLPAGYIYGYGCMGVTLPFANLFLTKNGLQPENDPEFPESEWTKSAGYNDDGEKLRSHIINLHKNREPRFYAWLAFDGGDYGTMMHNGQHPVY
ncbi:MAG: RagB/SusD family nutrient uptake outer membrane protein, partial [Muribaculaceae bacterium]|nr:RagB/SusD family nutrient uptake outer membrane protein [Muribaculaceae bacterium]